MAGSGRPLDRPVGGRHGRLVEGAGLLAFLLRDQTSGGASGAKLYLGLSRSGNLPEHRGCLPEGRRFPAHASILLRRAVADDAGGLFARPASESGAERAGSTGLGGCVGHGRGDPPRVLASGEFRPRFSSAFWRDALRGAGAWPSADRMWVSVRVLDARGDAFAKKR